MGEVAVDTLNGTRSARLTRARPGNKITGGKVLSSRTPRAVNLTLQKQLAELTQRFEGIEPEQVKALMAEKQIRLQRIVSPASTPRPPL